MDSSFTDDRIVPSREETEPSLFLQVFEKKSALTNPANTDREYGQSSPARKLFNKAFEEFQELNQSQSPDQALANTNEKFLDSIKEADKYTEDAQTVFYKNVSPQHMNSDKPDHELIEKLQLFSASLTQVMPGAREDLMRDLAKGKTDKLGSYDSVKQSYDAIPSTFASSTKPELIKSWLDYRAGIGDSIGQRQVYIGLQKRFGSNDVADEHESKVLEFKNRIGGRFVFD